MNLKSFNKQALLLGVIVASGVFAADLTNGIDVLSPAYVQSTELLSQVDQILASAELLSEKAFELQNYPGFDEERFAEVLNVLRTDLNIILSPERRRMEFQTIIPDGSFVLSNEN